MNSPRQRDVTDLLRAWSDGDQDALERLVPLVYDELRRMAERYLSQERPNHTLQPTALVHDVYCRLVAKTPDVGWQDQGHFFAVAARNMRQILVDHARTHARGKRGGGAPKASLDEVGEIAVKRPDDLVALDDSLDALAEMDPTKATIIELRFFGGLSVEETALTVGCSTATVMRQWRSARAWLYRQLSQEPSDDP